MLRYNSAFSGFSVNDLAGAKQFYTQTLGLDVQDEPMGLRLKLAGGSEVFVYAKDDHVPATYTMLNLVVDDIDTAVEQITAAGVVLLPYEGMTDDKGVARGLSNNRGPDIAWFKDPAGNILSVLQES
jgi:predicted enzyme related to lactoylglutathione lyase